MSLALGKRIQRMKTIPLAETPKEVNLSATARFYLFPVSASVKVVDKTFHDKGDVNWDGVIDRADLDQIEKAFGSKEGDVNWDPECDLNGDGVVNIMDVAVASSNFGNEAPTYTTDFTTKVLSGKLRMIATYRGKSIDTGIQNISADVNAIFVFHLLVSYFYFKGA